MGFEVMNRLRLLVLSLVAVMVMGAAPAFADDEVEPKEPEATEEEDGAKLGKGALFIATLIARHFEVILPDEDVDPADPPEGFDLELGFGQLFKLQLYSASGGDVDELLESACTGEGECEFEWGEAFEGLELPDGVKNLGQLISGAKKGHGRPDHAASNDKKPGEPGAHGKGKQR
jgi:hypothetical protein